MSNTHMTLPHLIAVVSVLLLLIGTIERSCALSLYPPSSSSSSSSSSLLLSSSSLLSSSRAVGNKYDGRRSGIFRNGGCNSRASSSCSTIGIHGRRFCYHGLHMTNVDRGDSDIVDENNNVGLNDDDGDKGGNHDHDRHNDAKGKTEVIAMDDHVEADNEQLHNSNRTDQELQTSLSSSSSSSSSIIVPNQTSPEGDRLTESSKIASYKEIAIFAGTTIIIWLSEPLLSLVDTTVVGKFSSGRALVSSSTAAIKSIGGISPEIIQLAALGPATMLCDTSIYLTYFLAIATTNQLAAASAKSDTNSLIRTTSHALGVAFLLGLAISLLILLQGGPIIRAILGTEGAIINGIDMAPSVISAALSYAKIRAAVTPLVIMGVVAQSVSLATLDTRTPALAVLAASVFNIVGDLVLVVVCGFGIEGAAVATAVAGSASSVVLLVEARKKVERWKRTDRERVRAARSRSDGSAPDGAPAVIGSTADGTGTSGEMGFVSFPDLRSLVSLCKLAGPIFFVMVGKVICYSATSFRASDFGMLPLAAHNIMLRIFYFFCTFGDSFSQVAQSFIPTVLYGNNGDGDGTTKGTGAEDTVNKPKDGSAIEPGAVSDNHLARSHGARNKIRTKQLLKKIIVLASAMALVNSSISRLIMQRCGSFFTNDGVIKSILTEPWNVLYVAGSVLFHPFLMAFEGSILATRDLGYLVGSYGLTMGALLLLLRYRTSTFTEVWRSLLLFQVIRFLLFGWRVWRKTRIVEESGD